MQVHNIVPNLDYIRIYVDAPYDIVVNEIEQCYLSNIPGSTAYSEMKMYSRVKHVSVKRSEWDVDGVPASHYYNVLVTLTEMHKSGKIKHKRTKIEVRGYRQVDVFATWWEYIHSNISLKMYLLTKPRGRALKVFPLVHAEIAQVDVSIDVNSKRIVYTEVLAIVEDFFYKGLCKGYRLTGFVGDAVGGRTLYLGDTVYSMTAVRIYEKGKHLNKEFVKVNAECRLVYPPTWIRFESVFKLKKKDRLVLGRGIQLHKACGSIVKLFKANPIIDRVYTLLHMTVDAMALLELMREELKESILWFHSDENSREVWNKHSKRRGIEVELPSEWSDEEYLDVDWEH